MARVVLILFALIAVSYIHAENRCGKNEKKNICGRMCEPTCKNRKPNRKGCPKIQCTEMTTACRCSKGFYRNDQTEECVRAKDCPSTRDKRSPDHFELVCRDNERLGNCGRMCEATCNNRNVTSCALMNCTEQGCQCAQGYLRNVDTDACVPVSMCPKARARRASRKPKKCRYGEILGACGRRCEGTCENPREPEICRRIKCADVACRCDLANGYVRDKKTSRCVRKKQCPQDASEDYR